MLSNYKNLDQSQIILANEILIKQGKLLIPDGSEEVGKNKDLAAALGMNLAAYGYVFDSETMEKLSAMHKTQLSMLWESIIDGINKYTGIEDFRNSKLFYPNFPEQVMDMSDVDLYLNSLAYYTGYYYFGVDIHDDLIPDEKKPRLPLIEKFPSEKKVLMMSSADELMTLVSDRIHSMGINESQEAELRLYAALFPEDMKTIINAPDMFASKENYVKVGDICASNNLIDIKTWFKDAPDVMRYAAYLSNKKGCHNSIDLSGKLQFKLSNSEKKLIREMLSSCPHLFEDVWTRPKEETWKHFARHIDCNNTYPERTNLAFTKLYHGDKTDEVGKPVMSIERQFEVAWENLCKTDLSNDAVKLSEIALRMQTLAESFPGLYIRHHLSYVDDAIKQHNSMLFNYTKLFASSAIETGKIPPVALLELMHVIDERYSSELRVFTKPNGDTQAKENEYKGLLSEENQKIVKDSIKTALINNLRNTKHLGKVYIDPQLADFRAPKRDIRNASGGAVLTKYSSINGKEGKNLMAIGAYWSGKGIDIDVSCDVYDKEYNQLGHLFYGNLKEDWGVHSGDYVTAPHGASEVCILDKDILKELGASYVGFNVRGFSAPFDQAKNGVQVIFMEKEGSLERSRSLDAHERDRRGCEKRRGDVTFLGEVIEPTQVEYPITLNAHATNETTFLYNVDEDKYIWVDKAGGNALGTNIMCKDQETRTLTEIYAIEHCTIPSMKEVIDAYIEAENGVRVDDIKEADTVFIAKTLDIVEEGIKEDAKIYSALDVNTFSAKFCACQEKLGDERVQDIGEPKHIVKDKEEMSTLESKISKAIAERESRRLANKSTLHVSKNELER